MQKLQDVNDCASHFWNSLSTHSEKENESSDTFGNILARQALLHLEEYSFSVKPTCRQNEAKEIENFIVQGIKMGGSSQTLYIAGMPGVGKTLTVTSVIDSLRSNTHYRKKFKSYYLNALSYKHPTKIYKSLLYQIFKIKNVSKSKQIVRLDYLFTTSNDSKVKVIVLDQLDYLLTEDQSVLYNLFQWTQNPNSKLILVAIANTLNLPQLLKQKTYSRMGSSSIAFRSYDKDQIFRIVIDRLKNIDIFDQDALKYACTKICSFSCDIRRILFILRTALNIFIEKSNSELVQIEHIQQAFNQTVRNKPECAFINSMPRTNQLILIYLAIESQCLPRVGKCTLSSVASRIRTSHPQICYQAVHRITIDFEQTGLLQLKQIVINHTLDTSIKLKIPIQEIKASIQNQEFHKLLQTLEG